MLLSMTGIAATVGGGVFGLLVMVLLCASKPKPKKDPPDPGQPADVEASAGASDAYSKPEAIEGNYSDADGIEGNYSDADGLEGNYSLAADPTSEAKNVDDVDGAYEDIPTVVNDSNKLKKTLSNRPSLPPQQPSTPNTHPSTISQHVPQSTPMTLPPSAVIHSSYQDDDDDEPPPVLPPKTVEAEQLYDTSGIMLSSPGGMVLSCPGGNVLSSPGMMETRLSKSAINPSPFVKANYVDEEDDDDEPPPVLPPKTLESEQLYDSATGASATF